MITTSVKRLVLVIASLAGIVLATGVPLTGQSATPPTAPRNLRIVAPSLAKVACIGDSITYGYELPADKSYPSELKRLLGAASDVRNYGRNGATALKRGDNPFWNMDLFQMSTTFRPTVAVIMLGTNDSKPNNWTTLSGEFEGDYVKLVQHYQGLGATVYVGIPPPAQAHGDYWQIDKVVPKVRNVIMTTGAIPIDVNKAMTGVPHLFMDDVHPNATGAAFLARVIYDAIRP
jgi:acyl-CoA thioesterase I